MGSFSYLTDNLLKKYTAQGVVSRPDNHLIEAFFKDLIAISSNYIAGQLKLEEKALAYYINRRIGRFDSEVSRKLNEIESILKKSIATEIVYTDERLQHDKENYTKLLKGKHKEAHIYLLDKFDLQDFYVPPFLIQDMTDRLGLQWYGFSRVSTIHVTKSKESFEDWKYIFDRNNIVYVTGGAGYGKTLFMKKLICDYDQLNVIDASEYMVIYGDLKNFFIKNSNTPLSVVDYLHDSMKRETLIEDCEISKELIRYYLKRGRCIVLLDALDEVDKAKRSELHESIINYFKYQNPNNKICITSRTRGFLPVKDVETFHIEPLDSIQIQRYVDNIIKLDKFDRNNKEHFLKQTEVLVEKGFLNSFLVLSLLLNIYKAEKELPENKLELYQKCFEYISKKRERDKQQELYDWNLIFLLMKDNTFMELANLCLPNNKDVSKDTIKKRLTEIYKAKYDSENQTELAIEQFLTFCNERTELFVPGSGEDCFKFFHRSFFEYFYSQYIFTRISDVNEIYEAWKSFDVDSEVFELTLAMFKQKNEFKYQELVEYLLEKLESVTIEDEERIYLLNVLILCMQVIDDIAYKKRFIKYIANNVSFCSKHQEKFTNQSLLIEFINSNGYTELIEEAYKDIARVEYISSFFNTFGKYRHGPGVGDKECIWKTERTSAINLDKESVMDFENRLLRFLSKSFYTDIYYSNHSFIDDLNSLSESEWFELGKKVGVSHSIISRGWFNYKLFLKGRTKLITAVEPATENGNEK